MTPVVRIKRLSSSQRGDETWDTRTSSKVVLVASIEIGDSIFIQPGKRQAVPTGLSIELPSGFEGQLVSDQRLCEDFGVCVLNSPGTIDEDYRGEVVAILQNFGSQPFEVNPGTSIAALRFRRYVRVELVEVESLDSTDRQNGGLGSTGI